MTAGAYCGIAGGRKQRFNNPRIIAPEHEVRNQRTPKTGVCPAIMPDNNISLDFPLREAPQHFRHSAVAGRLEMPAQDFRGSFRQQQIRLLRFFLPQ